MKPRCSIGLDVYKQKIGNGVKDSSGRLFVERWIAAVAPTALDGMAEQHPSACALGQHLTHLWR